MHIHRSRSNGMGPFFLIFLNTSGIDRVVHAVLKSYLRKLPSIRHVMLSEMTMKCL